MLSVGGWATMVAPVVLHDHTSLWHFYFLLFSDSTKVDQSCTRRWSGWVGEGTLMPMVALTNWAPLVGYCSALHAMCCAKVIFESEFVIQPPTECDRLPSNYIKIVVVHICLDLKGLNGTSHPIITSQLNLFT